MNEGLISKRYAKALYAHAQKLGQEKEFSVRMEGLIENLRSIPRLRETLNKPMVSLQDKTDLLNGAAGTSPEQSYLDFVRLILMNRREKSLTQIALSYLTLYRIKKNISIVHLISTEQLPPETLTRIQEDVTLQTNGTVQFSNHIDPSIKGGFIFQLNDLRLDASVANQLERIRRQFLQNNKTIV